MSNLSQFYGGGAGGSVPSQYKLVEFLLVGGGGASSAVAPAPPAGPSGGGAGEMIEAYNFAVKNGSTYTIGIGGGGAINPAAVGGFGGNSSFGNIMAFGGGGGTKNEYSSRPTLGGSSGGNTGTFNLGPAVSGTSYVTGDIKSRYNMILNTFNVITTVTSFASKGYENSGGGAGGSGSPLGSLGRDNSISGISSTYAKGGLNDIADANTGNGGGVAPTANGGSGVFIIRWPTAYPAASSVSGNTPTPAQPGYHVYRWNSGPGSITF